MTSLKLRPYQQDCLDAICKLHAQGANRQLVNLPTGSGKTIVFGSLIAQTGKRTLVLAHTTELLEQARDKILMLCPDVGVGLVNGQNKEFDSHVVVASIQSAMRPANLEILKSQGFDLCIADECHHFAAETQRQILNDLGFGKGTSRLLAGFTATAFRSDEKGLGEVFDVIAYQKTIKEMISDGYLCRPNGLRIATDLDLTTVTMVDGDFQALSLARVMDTPEINGLVVNSYLKSGCHCQTICFSVTVQHATNLAKAFNASGVLAQVISGAMGCEERASVLKDYRAGRVQVLCNCQVLTEGFDAPETACIIVAKPTRSKLLYQQMIGRGLRLWPNKRECVILDFCDRSHSLRSSHELLLDAECETAKDEQPEKNDVLARLPPQLNSKLKAAILAFDPLGESFTWERDAKGYFLRAGGTARLEILTVPGGDLNRVIFMRGSETQIVADGFPFEYAFGAAEDFARTNRQAFTVSDRQAPWRDSPATEKQISYIRKHGFKSGLKELSRGQASDLIASGALNRKAALRR
jgi:ATP-dependent helicase IRC3